MSNKNQEVPISRKIRKHDPEQRGYELSQCVTGFGDFEGHFHAISLRVEYILGKKHPASYNRVTRSRFSLEIRESRRRSSVQVVDLRSVKYPMAARPDFLAKRKSSS